MTCTFCETESEDLTIGSDGGKSRACPDCLLSAD